MAAATLAASRGEELKSLWLSLYDPVVAEKCSQQEHDLQGIAVLLGVTFSCFKRLKVQLNNTKHEYELTKNRLQVTLSDLSKVEGELKMKNEKPCERCKTLEDGLAEQQRKVRLNEERMKSIARILNLGGTQKVASDRDSGKQSQFAYAYSVVSQMLLDEKVEETVDSESQDPGNKRDEQKVEYKDFKCFDNATLVPETIPVHKPKLNIIVPETLVEEEEFCPDKPNKAETNEQLTPKKQMLGNKTAKENRSPVMNSSVRLPTRAGRIALVDAARTFKAESSSNDAPVISMVSPSLLKGEETVRCEVSEKRVQPSEDIERKRADKWILKPSNEPSSPVRFSNKLPARKLTQTKLSLAKVPKKVDVCSTQEFAGGVQHTSTLAVPKRPDEYDEDKVLQQVLKESLDEHNKLQENDDIVLESPNSSSIKSLQSSFKTSHGRSRSARHELSKRNGDPDETFFPGSSGDAVKRAKVCDSDNTEKLLAELGAPALTTSNLGIQPLAAAVTHSSAADKGNTNKGVNYIYQRDAVRGKVARSKLQGWACEDCRDLYEGLRLSEAEKKALINECSKHRDNFPTRSTSASDY